MKNIFSKEVPTWAEKLAVSLLIIEFTMLALTAETLYDCMPKPVLGYLLTLLTLEIILMQISRNDNNVQEKRKLHMDIKKIFRGISETSNTIEEEVIRRMKSELGTVINNGASCSSISADLSRIKFIASTKSMRLVEQYCRKALVATAIAHFGGYEQ